MKKFLLILSLISIFSCGIKEDTNKGNRLVLVGNSYYIYYDDEVIEIPSGTYLTKDTKVDDYFFSFMGKQIKDEKKLLVDLTKYFPHGITDIQRGSKPSNYTELPTYKVNGKTMVDSVKLADLLAGQDGEGLINSELSTDIIDVKNGDEVDPNVSLEGKKVEILNANGIPGFAKELGDALVNNLKMQYNAENYGKPSNFTYIVNHKLTDQELSKLINSLNFKYIKVLDDPNLKPDSDVVLITGNDEKVNYPINILTKNGSTELQNMLEGYKVVVKKDENVADGVVIKYNKEDILIAKKLQSILNDAKLEEDNSIKQGLIIQSSR